MAELAAGAVSSLLGVIRNEALLLRGVRDDVQFIKEEMESMKSFLAHLARWAPAGGEHDEQVRTWMNQVRLLAQDCNNCIDLYLYRGNPDIHRARAGLRRYIWWVSWFLHKMVAQHRAAVQLRQLKDRARDVGERRLRYGVEVPAKSVAGQSPPLAGTAATPSPSARAAASGGYAAAAAAGDDEEDGDDHSGGPGAFIRPRTLDDYVEEKLLEWGKEIPANADETMSIVIVAPDTYRDVLALAHETLVFPPDGAFDDRSGYHRVVLVDIPAVHHDFVPLRAKEVLYYILRELQLEDSKSQPQEQGTDEGEGEDEELDSWQVYCRKWVIWEEKKTALLKIKENIKEMKIYEKVDKIKSDIRVRPQKLDQRQQLLELDLEQKKGVDQLDIDILLQLLLQSAAATSQHDQLKNKDMHKLPVWDDNIIAKIAKKLKEHMEADDKSKKLKEQMGVEENEETTKHTEEEGERGEGSEGKGEGEGGGGESEGKGEGGGGERSKGKEGGEEGEQEEGSEGKGEEQGEGGGEQSEGKGEGEESEDKREEVEEKEEEEVEEEEEEEVTEHTTLIRLHEAQYVHILREVFPKTTNSKSQRAQQQDISSAKEPTTTTTTTLGMDQIKQMIHDAKKEILRELKEGKYENNQGTGEPGVQGQNPEPAFEEIEQKVDKIKEEIKEQLKIKRLVDEIKHHLKRDCPLIILRVDEMMDISRWEDIRNALSLLKCSADLLIVTTTKGTQQAKEYCYPRREPIDYSLAGLYHDTVLELTSHQKNQDNYNPQIFRNILEQCEPYEFCMKIFTHALHANPKRSNEELLKLHNTLQALPKLFNIIANKMFKFSYNDLPKEYKSCLLYLAIFPPGHKIRRSILIGRWVAEGLTFKEDWPSSVRQANRCFDALIHRCLVYPADIGATGNVKSCVVGDLIHGFITTIARKQHIVETRLSHHLARHFSIFNDLQLRSSDKIDKFFQRLSESSRVSLLKVLDLEGCQCFGGKNQRYLKDICSKMLLLKYLSLRGTNITQLPSEINYLRELEVLDIRQTNMPAYATVNILLLKLKRLVAGHIDTNPSNFDTVHTVQIPHRIDKMVNIEVLSNVKARHREDLKDIGKLWQLRKLGVVIDDKNSHLRDLLRTISDLHECLRSVSITLPIREGTPSNEELPHDIGSRLRHHPKLLESLSIRGTTLKGHLLPLFIKYGNNKLVKVTLSSSQLNQDDLDVLAKLPKLRCVRLRYITFTESMLTFKEDEFKYLNYFLIEGSYFTNITFEDGAARELEKLVLSFTSVESASGVNKLPKLEEVELNNSCGRLLSSFDNAKQIAKLTLRGTLLEQGDLQIIAKKPNLRCLVFLDKSCDVGQNQITLKKGEFPKLNLLIVDCSAITEIVFTAGCAPKLEKIVWSSFTSLSGINNLPRLKELEFNGDHVPNEVKEAIEKHKNKLNVKYNASETLDQAKGDEQEDDGAARFSFFRKKQV